MRNHFGCGPTIRRRRFAPALVADCFSDRQQSRVRGVQMLQDRGQVLQKCISLNREATSFFEGAGQLQDAAFGEMTGEDLHADG